MSLAVLRTPFLPFRFVKIQYIYGWKALDSERLEEKMFITRNKGNLLKMFITRQSLILPIFSALSKVAFNLCKLASFRTTLIHKFMAVGERKDKRKRSFIWRLNLRLLSSEFSRHVEEKTPKFIILGFLFSQSVDHKKCLW